MVIARNHSVDAVKGLLIFLVVVGHVLLGTLDDNILRYVIYSFHMPVFFFVSGYLLNVENMKTQPYGSVLKKYWHRMLFPWLLAWVVYTPLSLYFRGNLSLTAVVQNIFNSYYHLWFVPTLFLLVTMMWLIAQKAKSEVFPLLIIGISLLAYNLYKEVSIGTSFRYAYFLYLSLGYLSRRYLREINIPGGVIISAFILVVVLYKVVTDASFSSFNQFMGLPLLFFLCVFGFLPIMQKGKLHNPILELWGRQSLHIYLWHVIPVLILKKIFKNSEAEYYICSLVLIIIATLATGLYFKHPVFKRN